MSAIAVERRGWQAPGPRLARGSARGLATLSTFALLCGYGTLRWTTMVAGVPAGRFVGLIGLALCVAALGGAARAERASVRAAANVAIVVAALAMLPTAGVPFAWVAQLRVEAIARGLGDGIASLPGVLVPYRGDDPWTRAVIVLGAGMLMLGGALTLATSRQDLEVPPGRAASPSVGLGEARLAGAALPLLVLAIVPSALATPRLAWLHGLITFLLLALFVLRGRITRARGGIAILVAVAAAATTAAAVVGVHRPWVSVAKLTSKLAGGTERFNWTQTYGPLDWPATGDTVLTVQAAFPAYWKAEDLDRFNGRQWVAAPVGLPGGLAGVAPANLRRWTQTLTVTVRGISTREVIAAGFAGPPAFAGPIVDGASPGTYLSPSPLIDGDSYRVAVYTPSPSPAALAAAGTGYPLPDLAPDLAIELPAGAGAGREISFGAYGSGPPLVGGDGESSAGEAARLAHSPYAGVWALAQRLKARTRTPYQYLLAVQAYLSRANGFVYDRNPAAARYPLASFLLRTHRGYCQQFAGAMALLLRMGGVPARVVAGFTTGTPDPALHGYVVSDYDAHAWVEAWFPGYGWVTRDPTPAADPALGGGAASATAIAGSSGAAPAASAPASPRSLTGAGAAPAGRRPRGHGRNVASAVVALLLAVAALLLLALAAAAGARRFRPRQPPSSARRLAELERGLARCRVAVGGGVTLAELERRFADEPGAAEYVRRLRDGRFAPGAGRPPTVAQRRALRRALARGHGLRGRVRALLALPPARGMGR